MFSTRVIIVLCSLNETVLHRLQASEHFAPKWKHYFGGLGGAALLEEAYHWGVGFEISWLCLTSSLSLCFLCLLKDASSQPIVLAFSCHASMIDSYSPGRVSQVALPSLSCFIGDVLPQQQKVTNTFIFYFLLFRQSRESRGGGR